MFSLSCVYMRSIINVRNCDILFIRNCGVDLLLFFAQLV